MPVIRAIYWSDGRFYNCGTKGMYLESRWAKQRATRILNIARRTMARGNRTYVDRVEIQKYYTTPSGADDWRTLWQVEGEAIMDPPDYTEMDHIINSERIRQEDG